MKPALAIAALLCLALWAGGGYGGEWFGVGGYVRAGVWCGGGRVDVGVWWRRIPPNERSRLGGHQLV